MVVSKTQKHLDAEKHLGLQSLHGSHRSGATLWPNQRSILQLLPAATLTLLGCANTRSQSTEDPNRIPPGSQADAPQGGTASDGDDPSDKDPALSNCPVDCANVLSALSERGCYKLICNEALGQCEQVPNDGASCDDDLYCTTDDVCEDGTCVGGKARDCGTAMDCAMPLCDEASDACLSTTLADGSPCTNADLCMTLNACVSGTCSGTPKDCSFSSGNDDCNDAVCNPSNGLCEPEPVPDGTACSDGADLCALDTSCQSGLCVGGTPKDCGHLSQGCTEGQCNASTGSCEALPLSVGDSCSDVPDAQCSVGLCNASGSCESTPVADGTACKRLCHTGASCQAGACTGGSEDANCSTAYSRLAVGYLHSCGIKVDGSLYCWGDNGDGQLGLGDLGWATERTTPTQVDSATDWTTIALGFLHSCGLKADSSLHCWGRNEYAQLGLGDSGIGTARATPTQVGVATDWTTLALGNNHSCGLKANGSLHCWGRNDYGQLGLGDATDRTTPTQVGFATDWAAIGLDRQHSCGIKTDGSLHCWGRNDYGQLGLADSGAGTDRTIPTQVGSATDWASVELGYYHSCGTKTDGSLWCWGYNYDGVLGLGDSTDRTTPTQVGSATDWGAIALGVGHSCGIKFDGSLRCWGWNDYGQLGLGDFGSDTARNTPTQVGAATDWAAIRHGGNSSCGTKTDGSLWCWGRNLSGQLGLGDLGAGTDRSTPTQVGSATDWL
jgi:alpha-tubulin suppressor-like RCC1 family protein